MPPIESDPPKPFNPSVEHFPTPDAENLYLKGCIQRLTSRCLSEGAQNDVFTRNSEKYCRELAGTSLRVRTNMVEQGIAAIFSMLMNPGDRWAPRQTLQGLEEISGMQTASRALEAGDKKAICSELMNPNFKVGHLISAAVKTGGGEKAQNYSSFFWMIGIGAGILGIAGLAYGIRSYFAFRAETRAAQVAKALLQSTPKVANDNRYAKAAGFLFAGWGLSRLFEVA